MAILLLGLQSEKVMCHKRKSVFKVSGDSAKGGWPCDALAWLAAEWLEQHARLVGRTAGRDEGAAPVRTAAPTARRAA